jgi:MmgE/PrpD C-terminal domain
MTTERLTPARDLAAAAVPRSAVGESEDLRGILGHDQVVPRIDGGLHIVADDGGSLAAGPACAARAQPDCEAGLQNLLQKVTIRPDAGFTARCPAEVPSRVTVRLKSGESFTHEVSAYPGFSSQPFTWNEIEAKFDKLATDHTTAESRRDIKDAVRSLEDIRVSDLMKVLGDVKAG